MPTLPVDKDNHFLYYEDGGPPPNKTTYTTLIIVHGTAFHAGEHI